MSSDEEKQILKMVEAGKITADEAMKLIKALEEDTEDEAVRPGRADTVSQVVSLRERDGDEGHGLVDVPEIIEGHRPSFGSSPEPVEGLGDDSAPEFEEVKARARRFAAIPLGIGVVLTVLASYWLFALVQNANYGFWFACAWMPLLLGVLLVALSAGGMNARWLYVNVDQAPGERPQHITLGFPVPLGLAGWLLRTFGSFIPGMDRQQVEEILTLLATADAHGPLIVNVDEGERGERVQVYIG